MINYLQAKYPLSLALINEIWPYSKHRQLKQCWQSLQYKVKLAGYP